LRVEDREHAEVVLVEEFEDVFFVGVDGDGNEGIGLELSHVLLGGGKKDARDRRSAREVAELVQDDDGVQLFEVEVLLTEPGEDFVPRDGFAYEGELRVHHAAGGRRIEGEKFANLICFLIGHFLKELLGGFLGKIGEKVGGGVRSHFLDDVGGFFGIEFFDDLRGQAFVEFGEDSGSSFFIERRDDALALGGGKFLHHFGKIGRVQIFELFVGDAEFDAAEGIGLDKVNELPTDGALWKFALEFADQCGWRKALEEAADGSGNADVNLSDAEFDMRVGLKFSEVDVVDAHDLAAGGVYDLLVQKIFLDGEPSFVGMVGIESSFGDVQIDAAGGGFGDLIVTGDEGLEAPPRDQKVRDAVGSLGGFDKELTDATDVVRSRIVGSGAHEFGSVEHEVGENPSCRSCAQPAEYCYGPRFVKAGFSGTESEPLRKTAGLALTYGCCLGLPRQSGGWAAALQKKNREGETGAG
jgi:hypothetical protein